MASVEVFSTRTTDEDTRISLIQSISVSSKTSPSLKKRWDARVDRSEGCNNTNNNGGLEEKPRTKRAPSLSLQIKQNTESLHKSTPLKGTNSPILGKKENFVPSSSEPSHNSPPQSSANGSLELSNCGSSDLPRNQKSSYQPSEEDRPRSPLFVRNFLTSKIANHQQKEMLSDVEKPIVFNGTGDTTSHTTVGFSPKSPHSPLSSPIFPRKGVILSSGGRNDSSPKPQSPLFVRKFISSVIEDDQKKKEVKKSASTDKEHTVNNGNDFSVEELEDPFPDQGQQITSRNFSKTPSKETASQSVKVGATRVSTDKGFARAPSESDSSDSSEKTVRLDSSPLSKASLRSMSESNILDKGEDGMPEDGSTNLQPSSQHTLSSPNLNHPGKAGDKMADMSLSSSSPAASPSRSRFSSWFKRSSKHKAPGEDYSRHDSASPKASKSRSVSPGNSGKSTPLADSDTSGLKSPLSNTEEKKRGLSVKLQNWLRKDRSSSLPREETSHDTYSKATTSSASPELLSFVKLDTDSTPMDDVRLNVSPNTDSDKSEILQYGEEENENVIGPTATFVSPVAKSKSPSSPAPSAPVVRGRRGSMYEARPPLAPSRTYSPAASDPSLSSSTPTKKASTSKSTTAGAKSSLTTKSDKKVSDKKVSNTGNPSTEKKTSTTTTPFASSSSKRKENDGKRASASKVSHGSKSATSLHGSGSSLAVARTGSGSSVGSRRSMDSLKSSSVTSVKGSSIASLSSPRHTPTSPAHGKSSPFDRSPSAASTSSRTSGKSTPTRAGTKTTTTPKVKTNSPIASRKVTAPSAARTSTGSNATAKSASSRTTGVGSKLRAKSIDVTNSEPSSAAKSAKSKSTTSTPTRSKLSERSTDPVKPKASTVGKTSSKPASTVSANKPPSGFGMFRRRTSYAMAVDDDHSSSSSSKLKKKSSTDLIATVSEVGPLPTPVSTKAAPKFEKSTRNDLAEETLDESSTNEGKNSPNERVLESLRRRHISDSSVLNSVIEEEEEMGAEGPVLSPTHQHRKSAPAIGIQSKVIERSLGGVGRRRSVVTITPSLSTESPPPPKTTPTKTVPRRHSVAPSTRSAATLDRSGLAGRRQSAFDLGAGSKSATLGARGRRQSAYQRRTSETNPGLIEEPPKTATTRRRKSSLEGIKDYLSNKVGRRRRSSSEEAQGSASPSHKVPPGSLAEFEDIGVTTPKLTHQDHKITVRPKMRRPPSTGHLRSLMDRDDVTSDLKIHQPPRRSNTVDSNAWSTYMGKKKMDATAEASLQLKLDLNSVKLRKTVSGGAAEGGVGEDGPGSGAVVEYSNPPILLLQIKGRKHVQTVVIEPQAASLNSGDVFVLVTSKDLFYWIGSKANIMEKAKGTEIVERIWKKKELGCKAPSFLTIEEQKSERKAAVFWEHLGGKQKAKGADQGFKDEEYEKNQPAATIVYELTGEGDKAIFSVTQENIKQMPSVNMLDSTKIYVFDFASEVYLWVGKQSKISTRKRAMILARELFDNGCFPSHFHRKASPARRTSRSSIRLRRSSKGDVRSSMGKSKKSSAAKGIAASVTGGTGIDKVKKKRPQWAIFNRLNEGSETILFREKFSDWPDPTRIIKMKGHVSSGEKMEVTAMPEPAAVDPKVFLNPPQAYKGLVLDGENVYRGKGRMRPDDVRGTKVTTTALKKWHIKEYDHTLMPDDERGIFHSAEGYVIRWGFRPGVLRRLEGIHRGLSVQAQPTKTSRPVTWHSNSFPDILDTAEDTANSGEDILSPPQLEKGDPFAEDSDDEQDKNQGPVTEGGGSERCAYFFWQGKDSSITEKGAAALMTVELDEERGPQIRVPQGEEVPAFPNVFDGGMIVLDGSSEMNPLRISPKLKPCRLFTVRGNLKSEACLIEIPWIRNESMATQLRSQGCSVLHHMAGSTIYLWCGSKSTTALQKAAKRCVIKLKKMFDDSEVTPIEEGSESDTFWDLLNGREYISLQSTSRSLDYTPRMWQLSSATGEFAASEVLSSTRCESSTEAFPFLQSDLYGAEQPALFMLDEHYDIYVWAGWWPVQTDPRFREKNQFAGDANVRFIRDKRLAIQTALNFSKACERIREPKVHVVVAGYEHDKFCNHFPFWCRNAAVVEGNRQYVPLQFPHRLDAAEELKKLSRDQYSLAELQKSPLPEGVDPKKLESYLSDEEFASTFNMNKDQFAKLPIWKKTDLRKSNGLF